MTIDLKYLEQHVQILVPSVWKCYNMLVWIWTGNNDTLALAYANEIEYFFRLLVCCIERDLYRYISVTQGHIHTVLVFSLMYDRAADLWADGAEGSEGQMGSNASPPDELHYRTVMSLSDYSSCCQRKRSYWKWDLKYLIIEIINAGILPFKRLGLVISLLCSQRLN